MKSPKIRNGCVEFVNNKIQTAEIKKSKIQVEGIKRNGTPRKDSPDHGINRNSLSKNDPPILLKNQNIDQIKLNFENQRTPLAKNDQTRISLKNHKTLSNKFVGNKKIIRQLSKERRSTKTDLEKPKQQKKRLKSSTIIDTPNKFFQNLFEPKHLNNICINEADLYFSKVYRTIKSISVNKKGPPGKDSETDDKRKWIKLAPVKTDILSTKTIDRNSNLKQSQDFHSKLFNYKWSILWPFPKAM